MARRMLRTVMVPIVVVALGLGACGDDDAAPVDTTELGDAAASAGFPVTVEADNGPVTVVAPPDRVVSLSPSATEILYAVGAGAQVVAVDDQSTHPPEAPRTDLSGFDANAEGIATFDPDLVVLTFDPGDLVDGLDALGIPTIVHGTPASIDGAYEQIEQLAAVTGHPDAGAEVIADMEAGIEAAVAGLPEWEVAPTFFHELDDTLYTATSSSFIGGVYALLGLENIADAADDGSGFPQLSAEYVLDADPDLIFLADTVCCAQSAETVSARPGWDQLSAVRNGHVVGLDDDVASRWGPRLVEFVETVATATAPAAASAAESG